MLRFVVLLICAFALPVFAQDKPALAAAKAQFAKADRALNEAWAEAKKSLDEDRFNQLKTFQRTWVTFRDERAGVAGSEGQAEDAKPQNFPAYYTTAARLSEDRAAWLRRLVKGEEEPLTGIWIDGEGGTVEIVEDKGRLLFDLNVVRGKSFHLGSLAGAAQWNERIGWFSDKGRDKEKPEETNLAFVLRGLQLEIISAKSDYYHGARAYFDGFYFKAASLTPEQQKVTTRAGETGESAAAQ